MKTEVCGVLIGEDLSGTIEIRASIEALTATQAGTHVTFTQDAWEEIYRVKDEKFPDDPFAYEPGDMFLICSDGLTEGLYDNQIFELLRHPDGLERHSEAARRVVGAALERSGKDNTTAVVIEMI